MILPRPIIRYVPPPPIEAQIPAGPAFDFIRIELCRAFDYGLPEHYCDHVARGVMTADEARALANDPTGGYR